MHTKIYYIETAMGTIDKGLPFLSVEELAEFNTIGYTGKTTSLVETAFEEYLNTLGKGVFKVDRTMFDNGDFRERYSVFRACKEE